MADLYLPTTPLPQSASPVPIVFGGWQTPPTGGEDTWLGYMGNRMSLAIVTPKLKPEPDSRLWTGALLDALIGGLIVGCRFPQPGFTSRALPAAGGKVVVDGPGQSGSILKVRGLQPNAPVMRREFFHIVTSGRGTLYYATAQVIADATGRASVPIGPMLHVEPNDGDLCGFGNPMIEGKLTGDGKGWTMIIAGTQGLSFTITETR